MRQTRLQTFHFFDYCTRKYIREYRIDKLKAELR